MALSLVNVCVIPIYARLEDRRCCTVFGPPYVDYRAAVGGMVPRLRSLIRFSARAAQPLETNGPRSERDFVTTQ